MQQGNVINQIDCISATCKRKLLSTTFLNHKNALKIIRVIALNDVINFRIGEQVRESDEVLDELGVVGRFEEHPKFFGRERR